MKTQTEKDMRHLDNLVQYCLDLLLEDGQFASREELFENAIIQHKRLMEEFDMEPSAADEALWAALDGKWMFDSVNME